MPSKKMGAHEKTFARSLRGIITSRLRNSRYRGGEGIGESDDAWVWQPWLNTNIFHPKRWLYSIGIGYNREIHRINEKIRYFLASIDEFFERQNKDAPIKQIADFQKTYYLAKKLLDALQRRNIADTERLGKDGEKTLTIAGLRDSLRQAIDTYERVVNNFKQRAKQMRFELMPATLTMD